MSTDLGLYKGLLSKLASAKELMGEIMERVGPGGLRLPRDDPYSRPSFLGLNWRTMLATSLSIF